MATEWAVESHDARHIFEMMSLEGAQSGLSWLTILRKREYYRTCFHNFNVELVADMTSDDIDLIMNQQEKSVVKHKGKLKMHITPTNAV